MEKKRENLSACYTFIENTGRRFVTTKSCRPQLPRDNILIIAIIPHAIQDNPSYNYIIAGAGAAGLSLLMELIRTNALVDKTVLLLDRSEKVHNDRTWCFWEREPGPFESIVCHHWECIEFFGHSSFHLNKQADPYLYKMIRGIDFYEHCFNIIRQHQNISVMYGDIQEVKTSKEYAYVIVDDKKIIADYVFSSIYKKPALKKNEHWLLQHFMGWTVETDTDCFKPDTATLMDFRVPQSEGTTFVYVMPLSKRRALVEYTLFTEEIWPAEKYEGALQHYCHNFLLLPNYRVIDSEKGVIPMTDFSFPKQDGRIIFIGTAGGQTKGSSGYTFRFIQKQSAFIVQSILGKGYPVGSRTSTRFNFYDSVLLNVIATKKMAGDEVFTDMFKRNSLSKIFRFLDNESNVAEELGIISRLPFRPFIRAAIEQIL